MDTKIEFESQVFDLPQLSVPDDFNRNGYTIVRGVISDNGCLQIVTDLNSAMQRRDGDAIKAGQGSVVGGRNLLSHWDGWRAIVAQSLVTSFVRDHLGESAHVVRILFFDKPPGKGWSLALHKDRTIAVKRHIDPPAPFAKPTKKAGVPHVEANEELLHRMLTLRLHLDPMHDDNGPLMVVPGSHSGESNRDVETIHCNRGDLFVMRPLLSHGSRAANPETNDHRRVVHLELAPENELPGEYEWYDCRPIF